MSDHTLPQPQPSLKGLHQAIQKLGKKVDALDILAYQSQQLTFAYKQLALHCQQLIENMEHVDVLAFEIRSEFEKIKEHFKILIHEVPLTFFNFRVRRPIGAEVEE